MIVFLANINFIIRWEEVWLEDYPSGKVIKIFECINIYTQLLPEVFFSDIYIFFITGINFAFQ